MAICKILTSEDKIAQIADEWRRIQKEIGLAPFTEYDFAMAWWSSIGKPSGAKIMVVAVYEKEELVGVIPFSIRKKYGVRILRLIGHEVFYYRNFLVKEPSLMPFIWQTIFEQKLFDFADIKNIHKGTEEDKFLDGRIIKVHSSEVFYCEDLDYPIDEFMMRYSKSFRRKIRKTQNYIDKNDDLEIDYCRGEPVPQDVVEFLVNRKTQWTKERGKRGVFNENDPMGFYRKIIKISAETGKILLYKNIGGNRKNTSLLDA